MSYRDLFTDELLERLARFDVHEFSVREGEFSLLIRRGNGMEPRPAVQPRVSAEGPARTASGGPAAAAASAEALLEVRAPLVGTFYRSPAPGKPHFVEAGDSVKAGDTLCIVEAMKNMNEIQAETAGTVREICPQNGDLVEFDQVLFRIAPPASS